MVHYKILRPPLHKNFELPIKEILLNIKPDQVVKIIFQTDNEILERMWVKITKQINDSEWHGILDDDPVGEKLKKAIKAGDEVIFHPLDIIQIFIEN